jgi:hypothetical protein
MSVTSPFTPRFDETEARASASFAAAGIQRHKETP